MQKHAILALSCEVSIQAAAEGEGKLPTFSMVAYNGGPMRVGGYEHPVVVDLRGLKIEHQKIPTPFNHDLAQAVGHTESITVKDNQVIAEGVISRETAFANDVITSSKNGFPWQASIGASVFDYKLITAKTTKNINGADRVGPFYHVTSSLLKEISFVDLGADSQTSAKVAASELLENGDNMEDNRGDNMDSNIRDTKATKVAELKRQAAIEAACNGDVSLAAEAIEGGWSVEKCELEVFKANMPKPVNVNTGRGGSQASAPEILSAAHLMLVGQRELAGKSYSPQACEAADRLGLTCAQDLLAKSFSITGQTPPRGVDGQLRAAASTTSLPYSLADSNSKIIENSYRETEATWRPLANIKPVKNFHEHRSNRPYQGSSLFEAVGNGGELKHSTIEEASLTYKAQTRGRIIEITRDTIIGDDLGVVAELSEDLGRNAQRTIQQRFWQVVLGNGGSYFHADNANLLTGISNILGVAGIDTAVKMLRAMTDDSGYPISVNPRYLVVPPALEALARRVYSSENLIATGVGDSSSTEPAGNPWHGFLQPIVEPHLSAANGGSDTAWYLWGDPRSVPGVIVSFLNGNDKPTIEQISSGDTLGFKWRAYLDFGVDLGDPRGVVKVTGES